MNKLTFFTLAALLFAPLTALHAADAIPVQPLSKDHKAPVSLDADKDSKASPDAPAELVTQYVTHPMAVDALPHFSWALRDIDRDERQTAYQIIVASTLAGINGNVGNIWDSGKTFSSKSTQVHYAGNPLASDTRYWWKVRTWDKDGNASPWSAFANFDMGLTSAK